MIYIEKELDDLKKEVLEMWDLVNSQLNRAGEALLSMDKELAHEVTYREKRVNAFELKIDSDCEDIIGLYNPVALDLRFTLAMMKTSNNLERIADFCDGIARFVIDYPEVNIESELFEKTGIKEMLDIVKAMMLQAENALIEEKSSEAIAVFNKDNRVDELNHAAVPIIAEYLQQFPERADMEKKLDVVEAGKADWVKTVDDFYQGFEKSLEAAEKNMEGKKIKVEDIPTDEICEKCGRPMVIKSGRYGKFVACSGFPECRNAHPIVKDTGGLCPLCGGHMLLRKSAKGRVYYGCSNYPTCNFMTWDEPVPETCPHCGKTLFKRRGQLYCAKEGCGFVKNIEKTKAEK